MSSYHIDRHFSHPTHLVWRALTDPELVPRWTATGMGGRPVGFRPEVGTEFRYVAKPIPGWGGVVQCKVLAVEAERLLSYSWLGDEGDDLTTVTCRLLPERGGTQLVWEHTGFTGAGGFLMAQLLRRVRAKMLDEGLPSVLDDLAVHEAQTPSNPPPAPVLT